jgi:transcription elongation factor Elf1
MDVVSDCPECKSVNSVSIGPVSPNPESGDVADCDVCGWQSETF